MEAREQIAQPIACEKVCQHYSECYPFVNPVACNKIELWGDIAASVEHAGYRSPEQLQALIKEAVAKERRQIFKSAEYQTPHFVSGQILARYLTIKISEEEWQALVAERD